MSTAGIARKRLILKELRQLWPLIASSLIITVLLYLLVLIIRTNSIDRPMAWGVLVVGLPGLFAVGIGSMLVGQEKEQRTILWLQSLPLAKRDLVSSKLIAGLIGLAIVWIASLALVTVFAGGEYWGTGNQLAVDYWTSFSALPLHTLYLLLAGLAISWRVQSAFLGLILLVPIAFLPGIMTMLAASFLYPSRIEVVGSSLLVGSQLICCVAAAWLSWRYAMKTLSAAATVRTGVTTATKSVRFGTPYSKGSALLWQFAAQSKLTLWATVVMFVLSILLTLSLSKFDWNQFYFYSARSARYGNNFPGEMAFVAVALAFLATCWLGVLVFQSDRTNRRIRFLADRGLSPSLVWRTRQAIPICICLAAGIMLVVVATWVGMSSGPSFAKLVQELAALVVFPLLLISLATYSFSQWLAQLLPSPIVAAISAPPACLGVVVYYMACVTELGTPFLLLVLVALLPLVVTRVLMKRWMDDRLDWKYWTTHLATPLICIVLPLVPLAYTWLTTPTMDSTIRAALEEQAKSSSLVPASRSLNLILPLTRKEIRERAGVVEPGGRAMIGDIEFGGMAAALDESDSSETPNGALSSGGAATGAEDLAMPDPAAAGSATDSAATDRQATERLPALEYLPIYKRSNHILLKLNEQLDTLSGSSASVDPRTVQWLRTELMINRLAALNRTKPASTTSSGSATGTSEQPKPAGNQETANDESPTEADALLARISREVVPADRYNELLALAARIVEVVRRCTELNHQEMADRLEIVLVSELQQAQGKNLITKQTWDRVCQVIGDRHKRNTARRMSLAASWKKAEISKYQGNNPFIGSFNRSGLPTNLSQIITLRSRVGHLAELLWQLSHSVQLNSDSIKTELASILNVSPASYGLGNRGKFLKADKLDSYLFESSESHRLFALGSQWHGQWELLAEKFAAEQP